MLSFYSKDRIACLCQNSSAWQPTHCICHTIVCQCPGLKESLCSSPGVQADGGSVIFYMCLLRLYWRLIPSGDSADLPRKLSRSPVGCTLVRYIPLASTPFPGSNEIQEDSRMELGWPRGTWGRVIQTSSELGGL